MFSITPLTFTGNFISISIHFRSGAIFKEEFRFFAGSHLRASFSSIAGIAADWL
jgi:hypothetical protein